jgi:hypothetical protein
MNEKKNKWHTFFPLLPSRCKKLIFFILESVHVCEKQKVGLDGCHTKLCSPPVLWPTNIPLLPECPINFEPSNLATLQDLLIGARNRQEDSFFFVFRVELHVMSSAILHESLSFMPKDIVLLMREKLYMDKKIGIGIVMMFFRKESFASKKTWKFSFWIPRIPAVWNDFIVLQDSKHTVAFFDLFTKRFVFVNGELTHTGLSGEFRFLATPKALFVTDGDLVLQYSLNK